MAIYYIDPDTGNDANDGLSFNTRWKTFENGATAARIAAGDTIRVKASPDPTSIGNAKWTNGPRSGTISISSSTNATPIVVQTASSHQLLTGDYVLIFSHTGNTNANGLFKVGAVTTFTYQILNLDGTNTTGNGVGSGGLCCNFNNCIVELETPVTQNIALCGNLAQKPLWTASTNVVATQNLTAYKEGYSSAQIAISATFTTGKAAYYTLPTALDLSGYQQVSFWLQQTAGTIASNQCYLALCSDTLGATVVATIPVILSQNSSVWHQIVTNLGTNLPSSIRSIAFYVTADVGAQTFIIDNIIAGKAANSPDSLTHASLISKNTNDEAWFPIQSINNKVIAIANVNSFGFGNALRGYYGTTETITTYKREAFRQLPIASTFVANKINDSGVENNLIAYSGGWNSTDMSTQTGETWFDGTNGLGYCYGATGTTQSYNSLDKLNAVRFNRGVNFSGTTNQYNVVYNGKFTGCAVGILFSNNNVGTGPIWANNCQTGIIVSTFANIFGTIKSTSNTAGHGISSNSSNNTFISIDASNNNSLHGIQFANGSNNYVGNLTALANAQSAIDVGSGQNNRIGKGLSAFNQQSCVNMAAGSIFLNNFTANETLEFTSTDIVGTMYSNRHDDTDSNSWVFNGGWTANQQSVIVDSPATSAWKISPTATTGIFAVTVASPARLKLATVVCAANSLVTVTARMRRSNSGLTMRLVCFGGQISGVTSDVLSNMTAEADIWETVTITFTPTKSGAVDIYAQAYGGTTFSGYVCNLTASQA